MRNQLFYVRICVSFLALTFLLLPVQMSFAATLNQTDSHCDESPTISSIRDREYLIAGVKFDAPPFGSQDSEGNLKGFDVALVRELAKQIFNDEKGNLVKFVQVRSENREEMLQSGQVDIIAATLSYTPARAASIDYSLIYYEDDQSFLVRDVEDISESTDLLDKKIGVVKGSTATNQITATLESYDKTNLVVFERYTEALQPLANGQIDALATDRSILQGIIDTSTDDVRLKILDDSFGGEEYGLGLRKLENDPDFKGCIDAILCKIFLDDFPSVYQTIFGEEPQSSIDSQCSENKSIETPTESATPAIEAPISATATIPPTQTATVIPTPLSTQISTAAPTAIPSPATITKAPSPTAPQPLPTPSHLPLTGPTQPLAPTLLITILLIVGLALFVVVGKR